jgi:hypothetical protein
MLPLRTITTKAASLILADPVLHCTAATHRCLTAGQHPCLQDQRCPRTSYQNEKSPHSSPAQTAAAGLDPATFVPTWQHTEGPAADSACNAPPHATCLQVHCQSASLLLRRLQRAMPPS